MLTRRELLSAAVAFPASTLLDSLHFTQGTSSAALPPPVAEAMAHVHSELRPSLEVLMKTMGSFPPLTAETLSKQREMMNGFARPVLPSPAVSSGSTSTGV